MGRSEADVSVVVLHVDIFESYVVDIKSEGLFLAFLLLFVAGVLLVFLEGIDDKLEIGWFLLRWFE